MAAKACGCTTETCGCCEGVRILTPVSTENRPGLDALTYRVGTHGSFFETMQARLGSMTLSGPDGTALQPLTGLTTRNPDDPAIALLDGWATVADVLTFYQERIANEGYLRTSTERRSVLELARLVGYTLRPGVAATVYLAYTIDNNQATPVTIAAGARSQSIPGPGELPQSFETSDDLYARKEWNNLQVRLTQPQNVTFDNALEAAGIYVAGTSTNVKVGDSLLLSFGDNGDPAVVRKAASVDAQFDAQRTYIGFQPVEPKLLHAFKALVQFIRSIQGLADAGNILRIAEGLATQVRLGVPSNPVSWPPQLDSAAGIHDLQSAFQEFLDALRAALPPPPPPPKPTDPAHFVPALLLPPIVQARGALELSRNLGATFQINADVHPQMLLRFAPALKDTLYTAWSNAFVNDPGSSKTLYLKAVYAFRVEAPLFGASVSKIPTYDNGQLKNGQLKSPDQWDDWTLANDDRTNNLFLDQAYDAILPQSLVMTQQGTGSAATRTVIPVLSAQTEQRTAYGLSGKTTGLTFEKEWRLAGTGKLTDLRPVLVYGQAESLPLVDQPILSDVQGQEITLDGLYDGLTSGRWVILSGERTDIEGVTGVTGTELLMVSGLRQGPDPAVPGDTTRTTLLLATTTAYTYKRSKLTIYGNVVKATHGETKNETLGSGDGSQELQSFTLKQPPLTFVAAPNPTGVNSTLKIFVNNVEWHEADTLAGLGPKDRNFITQTDDKDNVTAIFGNGQDGARLPTGTQNITSVYRSGIGQPGNVQAGQISMLTTRPLGVSSVINPLHASGGADRENIDQARDNAPLAVMSLDRLVSVQDYADFTRTFAGIGKAAALRLSDGQRELVEITIAGEDDVPIDPSSDLYQNLALALAQYGDPDLPVQVDARELVVLVASVNISLAPDYLWEPVVQKVRAAVLNAFGFEKRSLGEAALLSELIRVIQNTEGVAYLDVLAFGGIPEKVAKPDGTRVLIDFKTMAGLIADLTGVTTTTSVNGVLVRSTAGGNVRQRVDVNQAGFENGAVRPAQLAIFTDAVVDTLILNQIL
jgi:predicted phage baseplate assembly protein